MHLQDSLKALIEIKLLKNANTTRFGKIPNFFHIFYRSSETWHSVGESEARQIYFLTLKALNAKNVQEVKPYGRYVRAHHMSYEFCNYKSFLVFFLNIFLLGITF